jgi:hypothetical protein
MGQVDVANQLRAPYTVHFNRNSKEFFPGMFWLINMVNTNCWKIFQSLNKSFLTFTTGNRDPRSHRHYLEILVNLMFLCTDTEYPEQIPQPPKHQPFSYPRFTYQPREQLKRKAIDELLQPIRGIPGRPVKQIPSFTPLVSHQHVPTSTRGHCIICRESSQQQKERKEDLSLGELVLSFTVQRPLEQEATSLTIQKVSRGPRGTNTAWKCSECLFPICKGLKGGVSCWDLAHRQIAR